MKATVQRKVYLTDEFDAEIRKKCAAAGKSFSRAAMEALRHWQPNRSRPTRHPHRTSFGPVMGLPGRTCLRL